MKFIREYIVVGLLFLPVVSNADSDVTVEGYYRSDGTYVRPHIRKSPDESFSNNYGPSQRDNELMNPRSRNYDGDSWSNYRDNDDDNDGINDNADRSQYGYERW